MEETAEGKLGARGESCLHFPGGLAHGVSTWKELRFCRTEEAWSPVMSYSGPLLLRYPFLSYMGRLHPSSRLVTVFPSGFSGL